MKPRLPNTRINYLYRDADNWKTLESVVVSGQVQFKDIKLYLREKEYFIPEQVGLNSLNGYDVRIDHSWHEIGAGCFELTDDKPTIELTVKELIAKFKQAHNEGWDDSPFNEVLAASLRESGYVVRPPRRKKNNLIK